MKNHEATFVVHFRAPSRKVGSAHTKSREKKPYVLRVAGARIRSRTALESAFLSARGARRATLFVSSSADDFASLAEVAHEERGNLRLLVFEKVSAARREYLQTLFRTVVSVDGSVHLTESSELVEVIGADKVRAPR